MSYIVTDEFCATNTIDDEIAFRVGCSLREKGLDDVCGSIVDNFVRSEFLNVFGIFG